MHILFTRPLDDSKDLILKFNDLGHKVSYMPVIEIQRIVLTTFTIVVLMIFLMQLIILIGQSIHKPQ